MRSSPSMPCSPHQLESQGQSDGSDPTAPSTCPSPRRSDLHDTLPMEHGVRHPQLSAHASHLWLRTKYYGRATAFIDTK